jgi:hypothetical protein
MTTQTKTSDPKFLLSVFNVAYETGDATTRCVTLLRKVNWNDVDRVSAIAREFKLGRICCYLALGSDAAAAERAASILKKRPFEAGAKDNDDRRTHKEHAACRTAIAGWSHIRKLCDAPSAQTGAKRGTTKSAPKAAPKAEAEKPVAPVTPVAITSPRDLVLATPRATKVADVHAFMLQACTMLRAYEDRNAKVMPGDLRTLVADFVAKVKLLSASVTGEAVKPPA